LKPAASGTLLTARIIAGAIAGSVALFLAVALVVTGGGRNPVAPAALPTMVALVCWAVVAVPGMAGALFFRERAVRTSEMGLSDDDAGAGAAARVQTNLVIAWSLLEGPALLGIVFFFMIGPSVLARMSAAVFAVGMLITWPRAERFAGTSEPARFGGSWD